MFLIIRIPPELAIVLVIFTMITIVIRLIKGIRFLNKKNVETEKTQITDCKSTRYNHIAYINEFTYTYRVEGEEYEKKDREVLVFRKNRTEYPTFDTVEYLKSNPKCSRLKLVKRKWEIPNCFLELIFCALLIAYIVIRYL